MSPTGTSLWLSPNTAATNESGFTGLPAGYRGDGGAFDGIGTNGIWWSSSEFTTPGAWHRNLNYNIGNATRNYNYKENGFSVRCLRD